MKIVLASGSPRRREILSGLGLDFEIAVSDADEGTVEKNGVPPDIYVQELALLKANAVFKHGKYAEKTLIISADTVVVLDGEILGKPSGRDDAFDMLSRLSGREHSVYTGICVIDTERAFEATAVCETRVMFDDADAGRINAYINTGEPADKAGAYGIQGLGALLIKGIKGDYFNVVGLPVKTLADLLKKEFEFDILGGK
ncbi:MAG: septum formation protein Maf [Oscillospiraceae bacterium]|nr:septum formation protein Maf [Oscillospiraceae bacterium]